ncbi:MAG: hypothetical protein GYA26_01745 [Flexilinea flocculi]|jgi:hypothetical protein|nr:hypothetical protein [Flexilinea flocculi]
MKNITLLKNIKKNIWFALLGLILLVPSLPVAASALEQRNAQNISQSQNDLRGRNTASTQEPLSETEENFLQEAILEEYGAYNLYQYITENYFDGKPFQNIMQSELKHIDALIRQAEKYNLAVPENPGLSSEPVFDNLEDACQAGVDAELADAALYDELLPSIEHSDIIRVFNNLKNASLNNHLPAFEKCN